MPLSIEPDLPASRTLASPSHNRCHPRQEASRSALDFLLLVCRNDVPSKMMKSAEVLRISTTGVDNMDTDRSRFLDVVAKSRDARDRVRKLVEDKRWREAEPDRARMALYTMRTARQNFPGGAEAIQGADDMQASWFLPGGATARRAIGFVEASSAGKWTAGSGFLVSTGLFLTNQHVVADASVAATTQVTFDREMGEDGFMRPTTTFRLDAARFALFSGQEELDYAIIALGAPIGGSADPTDLGFCVLSDRPDKHVIGMNVNIVQHLNALPKMVALGNNILQYRTDRDSSLRNGHRSRLVLPAPPSSTIHGSSSHSTISARPSLERKDDQGRAGYLRTLTRAYGSAQSTAISRLACLRLMTASARSCRLRSTIRKACLQVPAENGSRRPGLRTAAWRASKIQGMQQP